MKNKLSYKKIFLILILFLLLITGMRLGWFYMYQMPDHPHPQKGYVDLSNWDVSNEQPITLDGEWEFFPNEFIDPKQANSHLQGTFLEVPGSWEDFQDSDEPKYGYGTYRLQITLPDDDIDQYGLVFRRIINDSEVFINGEHIDTFGTPETYPGKSTGRNVPHTTEFQVNQNELNLIIHVSNYEIPFYGGMISSVQLGTEGATIKERSLTKTLQLIVAIIFLLHALYAGIVLYLSKGKYVKEVLYFGLYLLLSGFIILIDDNAVLELPLSMEKEYKLLLFLLLTKLLILIRFIYILFQSYTLNRNVFRALTILYGVSIAGMFIVPFTSYIYFGIFVALFYVTAVIFLFIQTIRVIRQGFNDAIYILLFFVCFVANAVWGAGLKSNLVTVNYYPFDDILPIILIAILLFKLSIKLADSHSIQAKALLEADKQKDEFLRNTSHELRNPLHGVINIAQAVLWNSGKTLTAKNKEDLELLINISQHMNHTLTDLLDATKLGDHDIELHLRKIDLHMSAQAVLDMNRFIAADKQIAFHMEIPEHFPKVEADINRLTQVLFNLIHNAVKYTYEGSITIKAEQERKMARIYIIDTGIGISKEVQDKIFEPYKREKADGTDAVGGMGLGLAISRKLIELHGGRLMLDSTSKTGTTFSFTIPLATKHTLVEMDDEAAATNIYQIGKPIDWKSTVLPPSGTNEMPMEMTENASILIVDNNSINLKVIANVLAPHYHVRTTNDGEKALMLLKKGLWDLVISDIMMPGMSGYTLTEEIRKQYSHINLPVLLLTARDNPEDVYAGFLAGANDYVTKPVNALELLARVDALTKMKQSVIKKLQTESAWLQAQIQPHFLFNTLNAITSLGEFNIPRMKNLLIAFNTFLQDSYAFYNRDSLVQIEDELNFIQSYVYIQKERFGNRFNVQWEVDDNMHLEIPPLSIQPLVENAIVHGVLKQTKGGTITISVKQDGNYGEIAVIDNGPGMDKATIDSLLDGKNGKRGIGISNTHLRLKQLYGQGLSITSTVGEGTQIYFRIPMQRTIDE